MIATTLQPPSFRGQQYQVGPWRHEHSPGHHPSPTPWVCASLVLWENSCPAS